MAISAFSFGPVLGSRCDHGALTALQACLLPTDESDALAVRIDALSTIVIRGEAILLRASAATRDPSGNVLKPGVVTFTWSSDDRRPQSSFPESAYHSADGSSTVIDLNGPTLAEDGTVGLDLVTGVSEVLTIDQPLDLDWFRFSPPEALEGPRLVTIRTASLPFGATDSSNLGIGLVSLNSVFGCCAESWTAEARAPGDPSQLSRSARRGSSATLGPSRASHPGAAIRPPRK
jgi:hypothetical protein